MRVTSEQSGYRSVACGRGTHDKCEGSCYSLSSNEPIPCGCACHAAPQYAIMDNDAIYDAQIAPLMARIIRICKANGIPFAAVFQTDGGQRAGDPDNPVFCTTTTLIAGQHSYMDGVIRRLAGSVKRGQYLGDAPDTPA